MDAIEILRKKENDEGNRGSWDGDGVMLVEVKSCMICCHHAFGHEAEYIHYSELWHFFSSSHVSNTNPNSLRVWVWIREPNSISNVCFSFSFSHTYIKCTSQFLLVFMYTEGIVCTYI